ncbi:MAG: hypothetical protein ACOYKE_09730 [Ferruginibacter sp.]
MRTIIIGLFLLQATQVVSAQNELPFKPKFSLGTRVTYSPIKAINYMGNGLGGQIRFQPIARLNTEWYLDYMISSTALTAKKSTYIGWSLLLYSKNNYNFSRAIQPFLSIGHCFDRTLVYEKANPNNRATRVTMATHAGAGAHFNIFPRFDITFNAKYMVHLGKNIETLQSNDKLVIQPAIENHFDGHLLMNLSLNYQLSRN